MAITEKKKQRGRPWAKTKSTPEVVAEIKRLRREGLKIREIAERFPDISEGTVSKHAQCAWD